jgi:hypothetical protein
MTLASRPLRILGTIAVVGTISVFSAGTAAQAPPVT